jgi:hypothetical protein
MRLARCARRRDCDDAPQQNAFPLGGQTGIVPHWIETFLVTAVGATLLGILGFFGTMRHPRFRVRGQLPSSPTIRRLEKSLAIFFGVVGLGMAFLLAVRSGGPTFLALPGAIVMATGFAAALTCFGFLVRERVRRRR